MRIIVLSILFAGLMASGAASSEAVRVCDQAGECRKPLLQRLTKKALGDQWPFTAHEAMVLCVPGLEDYTRIFVVEGTAWSVHAPTMEFVASRGTSVRINNHAMPVSQRVFSVLQVLS